MEEEIEGEGAEIDECGEEAPVLREFDGFNKMLYFFQKERERDQVGTYLVLDEHSTKTIEQLKRGDDMTLHQKRRGYGSDGPPARTNGHFIEPLFQRKLTHCTTAATADAPAEKIVHVHQRRLIVPERVVVSIMRRRKLRSESWIGMRI